SRPVARLVPPKLRSHVKSIVAGLRPARRLASLPAAAKGLRVHQIINSIDLTQGGAERIARRLHQEMRHRNIDARLVALQDCDVENMDGAISLGLKSPYDPRAVLRLAQYAKEIGAGDVVHVHLFPTSAHVSLLARTGKIKGNIVFTEHNSSNRRRSHPLGSLIDRNIYPAFQKVIAISDGVKRELVEARPSLSDRTLVIQNGCPLHFADPLLRDPAKSPLKIISVGRLVAAKNFPTALEAFARLDPQSATYTIAGSGQDQDALNGLSQDLGIADRVTFAGHVNDVPSLLRSADIFLIPSLWEGFGLAAVEAMNASLPIIASDVTGLREVVGTDGKAAFIVDSADTDAIAVRLQQLIDDASLRATMGRHGFERAKAFDYKRWVTSHLDLYHSLAEHGADAA
ncbi:MAG: glycosyltransferase, partial [Pseudomonadota bacterium]